MDELEQNEAEESAPQADGGVEEEEVCEESACEDVADEEQGQEDYREKFYYLAAEMDNLRKRHERDREELLKYGNERIIRELLEVVDNLDRTLLAIGGDDDVKVKNIYMGIEMVRSQFAEVLKNNGIEPIDESVGEKFDPNFHEAMSQRKSEECEDDTIVEEYQKGYVLNGRLLRPSKVVIVKNN